jgi:hypothetical protein
MPVTPPGSATSEITVSLSAYTAGQILAAFMLYLLKCFVMKRLIAAVLIFMDIQCFALRTGDTKHERKRSLKELRCPRHPARDTKLAKKPKVLF